MSDSTRRTRLAALHRPIRDRLAAKDSRPQDRVEDAMATAPSEGVVLRRPEEIAAAAVGLLVLRQVENHGRTRLYERAIENAIAQLTDHLDAREMMRLEVEAWEILDWLVGDDNPVTSDPKIARIEGSHVDYDPNAQTIDLVREAIFQGFKLKIDYFTRNRSQMSTRVIAPLAIAADSYVRAYCYARHAQRIFRVERIHRCIPVDGRPVLGDGPIPQEPATDTTGAQSAGEQKKTSARPSKNDETEHTTEQLSLLGDDKD